VACTATQQEDDERDKTPVKFNHNEVLVWERGLCARISRFMVNLSRYVKITVRQQRENRSWISEGVFSEGSRNEYTILLFKFNFLRTALLWVISQRVLRNNPEERSCQLLRGGSQKLFSRV